MKKMWFVFLLISLCITAGSGGDASETCLVCHGNAQKMKELGYPQFSVTLEEVETQTKMPGLCSGCHLGNPAATTQNEQARPDQSFNRSS